MNNLSWLYPIIIGAVAGWLAGLIKSGYGFGLLGNIVIGIIGSYIGGGVFVLFRSMGYRSQGQLFYTKALNISTGVTMPTNSSPFTTGRQ